MDKIPSLEGFCLDDGSKNNVPEKDCPAYLRTITQESNPAVIRVSLERLSQALRGDETWATCREERNADTFKPEKYVQALEAVEEGSPLYRPWLVVLEGFLQIMDGRHRLYALIDSGYSHVEVVCDNNQLNAVEALL